MVSEFELWEKYEQASYITRRIMVQRFYTKFAPSYLLLIQWVLFCCRTTSYKETMNKLRIFRGGAYIAYPYDVRSPYRSTWHFQFFRQPNAGLRIVRKLWTTPIQFVEDHTALVPLIYDAHSIFWTSDAFDSSMSDYIFLGGNYE